MSWRSAVIRAMAGGRSRTMKWYTLDSPLPEDTIYFDGGCSPNPGPMMVAIVCRDDKLVRQLEGVEGGNNEAEFRAAGAALDYAAVNGMRQSVIAGDSDAVIAALGARRLPKPGRLTRLYEECVAKDDALGGAVWRRAPRDNPAGRLIAAERRIEKAARRRARGGAPPGA